MLPLLIKSGYIVPLIGAAICSYLIFDIAFSHVEVWQMAKKAKTNILLCLFIFLLTIIYCLSVW